jgi:hypothetical protein
VGKVLLAALDQLLQAGTAAVQVAVQAQLAVMDQVR